jgi:hypothetical protein
VTWEYIPVVVKTLEGGGGVERPSRWAHHSLYTSCNSTALYAFTKTWSTVTMAHPALNREENEMGGTCSTHGRTRNGYRILVRKPEGKEPYRISTHRRVNVPVLN